MHSTASTFTTSELESSIDGDVLQVDFDLQDSPVNVFNSAVFDELNEVLDFVEQTDNVAGLIFTSSKDVFAVGADIPVLLDMAKNKSVEEVEGFISHGHQVLDRLQALPVPTVAAINGLALGGGLEFALAMDARCIAINARVGLPEVNLGLLPGWGGTVRLPRIIDPEIAASWIASGKHQRPDKALKAGLVTAITTQQDLLTNAVRQLASVQVSFEKIRAAKMQPILVSEPSQKKIDELLAELKVRPGLNYPAAFKSVSAILEQAPMGSLEASKAEVREFATLLKTDTAINLLSVFINQQDAMRTAKKYARRSEPVTSAAVIGAGIMGGGITYQSALRNIPTIMKDIRQKALKLGMGVADWNFSVQVSKGRLDEEAKAAALARIKPTLQMADLAEVDAIIEAVPEDFEVKKSVIGDLEAVVGKQTVIASNTSTIAITRIGEHLQRPENFCGMHFFNPVPLMPLVEIVRGEKTSKKTISRIVSYALQLGKNPVVVNDCPGFFVNRVLTPYINAAHKMIDEGVDFQQLDVVMEGWGWPMGPAHMSDVIGIDIMVRMLDVLAVDYADRMALDYESANHILSKHARLGQKNGAGFYRHTRNDETQLAAKHVDDSTNTLLYDDAPSLASPEEIEERLMTAMCLEVVRCLQDGIVGSAAEADMALLWGLGFPRFRGGALRHIDTIGLEKFCAIADKYGHLGAMYHLPELLIEKRDTDSPFYM
ncbi:MAG: enoyl-CoA hydratase/isomerase family protein [Arenicella sp.]|nr:enoyl-CoA hydratase/isomerase family protein [Arenicella sp.]